jgi:hypothetical protein
MILPKIILPSKIPGLRHRVARRAPGQALLFLQTLYLLEINVQRI